MDVLRSTAFSEWVGGTTAIAAATRYFAKGTPPATRPALRALPQQHIQRRGHSPNPRLKGGQWSGGRCGGPCSEPEIDSNYCYYYCIILLAAFERGGGFRKAVGSMPLEAAFRCPYPSGCRKMAALVRHVFIKPFYKMIWGIALG